MLDQIATDTMLQLEWLTAMHFHKMINDYRNSKNYKSIQWDYKLWMAARNHNVYLLRNDGFLSHSESEGNLFFTGKRSQDRVDYVTYFSNEFELAGFENCNFSGFEISIDKIDKAIIRDVSVEKMNDLAKKTSKNGYEIWRKSSGHNKNMLNPQHIAHGTSFIYGKEGVYGTSVFANHQKYYEADSLMIPYLLEFIEADSFKVKTEYSITSPFKDQISIINRKQLYNLNLFFELNEIKLNKRLTEIAQLKPFPENKKQLHKAYRKTTGIKGFFELISHDISVKDFRFKLALSSFKNLEGISILKDQLSDFLHEQSKELIYWGGYLTSMNSGDEIDIGFRFVLMKKKNVKHKSHPNNFN